MKKSTHQSLGSGTWQACTQCSAPFEITNDDLKFLEKVSPEFGGKKYLIPPPTLCPDCRVQRRMAWRNDRTFYHRKCDKTGQMFISMYSPDTVFPVYKQDEWHKDCWEGLDYGREYDFSRSFFEQWGALRDAVPHWGVAISNCENSDYCNYCTDEKNCYLDIAAEGNEECFFDLFVKNSVHCVDCTFVYDSELCYECIQCYNAYACRNSMYLDSCTDCTFCFDLKGCKNCLLSTNLRNKEFYILNKQHTKEEYAEKLKELNLSSHSSIRNVEGIWKTMRIENGVYRDMVLINAEQCSGNDIKNSKNCAHCFNATDCEDCAYLYDVLNAKDCRDMNYSLYDPEASYEIISTVGTKFCAFLMAGPYNTNSFYCQQMKSCKNCFGCQGLKNKQYCILNKQYTKEEYEVLVPKIIEHMCNDGGRAMNRASGASSGSWGEFFPAALSPHGYNETVAQEYMPLTKEETLKRGWNWVEESESGEHYLGSPIEISDSLTDIDDSICGQVLLCEVTKKPYKIILQELAFYKRMGIPIPRKSPAQRHKDRSVLRNPRKLWARKCGKCKKDIQTTYSLDRPEIVYCETCYLQAVY